MLPLHALILPPPVEEDREDDQSTDNDRDADDGRDDHGLALPIVAAGYLDHGVIDIVLDAGVVAGVALGPAFLLVNLIAVGDMLEVDVHEKTYPRTGVVVSVKGVAVFCPVLFP